MKDVNRVTLLGRLGADPIRRETQNGRAVVQFPVATARRYRVNDGAGDGEANDASQKPTEWHEETQWHRVVVWGKQAEACAQYLKKGQPIYVEGSLRSRKFEDQEGVERYSFEVHAETFSFISAPKTVEMKSA